ncbi:MAG: hypothetical protein ACREOI_19650, partial [bacterium]
DGEDSQKKAAQFFERDVVGVCGGERHRAIISQLKRGLLPSSKAKDSNDNEVYNSRYFAHQKQAFLFSLDEKILEK